MNIVSAFHNGISATNGLKKLGIGFRYSIVCDLVLHKDFLNLWGIRRPFGTNDVWDSQNSDILSIQLEDKNQLLFEFYDGKYWLVSKSAQ